MPRMYRIANDPTPYMHENILLRFVLCESTLKLSDLPFRTATPPTLSKEIGPAWCIIVPPRKTHIVGSLLSSPHRPLAGAL